MTGRNHSWQHLFRSLLPNLYVGLRISDPVPSATAGSGNWIHISVLIIANKRVATYIFGIVAKKNPFRSSERKFMRYRMAFSSGRFFHCQTAERCGGIPGRKVTKLCCPIMSAVTGRKLCW